MAETRSHDYYYGDESTQFSFYRIPRELVSGAGFKGLSTDAKLLYGLLLDRMGLSAKNGWYDAQGRVYIYYTLEEIQEDMNCGHDKATKLLVELDTGKGYGLIERVRQGQGKPSRVYVKRFTTRAIPPQSSAPQAIPRQRPYSGPDCGKAAFKGAEKPHSRARESRAQECGKAAASYIKSNQTDISQLDLSIHPSVSKLDALSSPPGSMDGYDCREAIQERIEYESLCQQYSPEDVEEVVELLTDVLCTTRPTLRVGGGDIPTVQVKERLWRLDFTHIEYVFDCLRESSADVRNIRAYLLTALYNAPATINHYYGAAVRGDWPSG